MNGPGRGRMEPLSLPEIGPAVPRRGNRLSRGMAYLLLRLLGWRVEGSIPDLPRFVIIGAPHSSNWDFVIAMPAVLALGLRVTILGKHTLFDTPLAPLMRWCGVIPVDRSHPSGVVGACVQALKGADRLVLGLAPEGTRRPGAPWRSGFWHIAHQAGVPIVPVALDYGRRRFRIGAPLMPRGDLRADLDILAAFYEGTRGAKRTMHGPLPLAGQAEARR